LSPAGLERRRQGALVKRGATVTKTPGAAAGISEPDAGSAPEHDGKPPQRAQQRYPSRTAQELAAGFGWIHGDGIHRVGSGTALAARFGPMFMARILRSNPAYRRWR